MILRPVTAGTAGTLDHGALDGLDDDDHAAYLRIGTARGLTGERVYIGSGPEGAYYFEVVDGRLTLNAKGTVEQIW